MFLWIFSFYWMQLKKLPLETTSFKNHFSRNWMIYWCSRQVDDILMFRTIGWYIDVQEIWMIYWYSGQLDDILVYMTVGWYIDVQDSWMIYWCSGQFMIYWCSGQLDDILMFRTVGWYISCSGQLDEFRNETCSEVAKKFNYTECSVEVRVFLRFLKERIINPYIYILATRGRRPLICQAFSPAKIFERSKVHKIRL